MRLDGYIKEKEMKREFNTKLEEAKQMTGIQGSSGNWDFDPYMHGMFNGMEYLLAIFEEREPKFKDAPEKWLSDKPIKSRKIN